MPVVAAFLVPGTPLPYLKPDNPPWTPLAEGFKAAAAALKAAEPDVLLIYSTQWIAVLDQLWQTRDHVTGLHVDENWYEFGDLPFDMTVDRELAEAAVAATPDIGIRSRAVDYDGFPIDTGSIVADGFLNPENRYRRVMTSNNLYHGAAQTAALGRVAVAAGDSLGRRMALIGVGGLSGTLFRERIDIAEDRIANEGDDGWNRRVLDLLESGDSAGLDATLPDYAFEARADMGMKHLHWVLGGTGGFTGAKVHAYGPNYGSGAAIVEFEF